MTWNRNTIFKKLISIAFISEFRVFNVNILQQELLEKNLDAF